MQSPSSPESPAQATLDSAQKRSRQAKKSTRGKDVEQNNMKRNKTTRACDECRKRKVKCDGEQPCEKCRKADTPCVYAKLPPKRGPPKQYMEVLEARLRLVEKALRRIDGTAGKILDEAFESSQSQEGDEPMDTTIMKEESVELSSAAAPSSPNPTNEGDRFCINEIGQAMYVNDIKANIDRMSSMQTDFKGPPFAQPSSQSFQTDNDVEQFMDSDMDVPLAGLPSDAPLSLIKTYFKHVHRYVPMLYQPFFYKQLGSKDNPPSPLLIYAMCAVASRWATDQENAAGGASGSGAPMPPGFQYYQRAFALIDEYSDAPRIQTIQALLLLTKYQEYYRRLGFFHRPGLYLGMAVRMCSDLGLPKLKYRSEHPHDAETKKRTFWMIFMYDLMMSIEQGREPCLSKIECTADYPLFTNEENPTVEELLLHHNTLIQLCKILSDIYLLSRRIATRQHQQGDHRSLQQAVEEHGRLFLLNTHLENFLHELPATLAYPPSQDSQSYPADKHSINDHFVGFLHMTFHFSIILLHRHYVQHPLPKDQVEIEPYEHKQYCLASASHITNIAETMLDSQPMEVFNYPFRGVQHSIHCLTMAATVHRDEMLMNPENEAAKQQYLKTLNILNRLASESPAVEFHSHIKEAELAQMYGRLAVDSSRTSPVHSSARSTSSSSTDGTVAATNDRVSISDASSTSSSPVMSSSADMSRPARAIKLPKSRRHTMTAPSSTGSQLMQIAKQTPVQRQPHMPYQMDQSFLLNSSATFTDPARFATMMMQSGNSMHLYNHHQQPISCAPPQQPFHQPFSPSPAYLQRKSRLGHHSSYSQEDLRSLRRAHMNKPISGGNWPPAQTRSPAQTSDFPYTEQQPNRMTRQLRRQSSMTAMMPSYYAQRQQQQQLMPPQLATPRQQTMQAPPFPMEHHRRHTISNPGTGPVYPVTTIPTPDQVIQQQQQQPPQQPFVQSNMYYDMNLDKFNELSYQDVSMTTTPDTQTMMLDPPSLPTDDTVLMNELLNDQAQWPIMTNASGYEDMQRSEGHVM